MELEPIKSWDENGNRNCNAQNEILNGSAKAESKPAPEVLRKIKLQPVVVRDIPDDVDKQEEIFEIFLEDDDVDKQVKKTARSSNSKGTVSVNTLRCYCLPGLNTANTRYQRRRDRPYQRHQRRQLSSISSIADGMSTASNLSTRHTSEARTAAQEHFKENQIRAFSCMYTAFIVTLAGALYLVYHLNLHVVHIQVFASVLLSLAIAWLTFLHIDFAINKKKISKLASDEVLPFRLLPEGRNRHLYTKVASIVLFLGHLIHEGLRLCQQVHYYAVERGEQASSSLSVFSLILHILRPLYSLLQLFMILKYADIIIDRYQTLAKFAFMHCIGTNVCIWIASTIGSAMDATGRSIDDLILKDGVYFSSSSSPKGQSNSQLVDIQGCHKAAPYISNFTIEYSLVVIRVWFVIWQHIGQKCPIESCVSSKNKIEGVAGNDNLNLGVRIPSRKKLNWSNSKLGLIAGGSLALSSIICMVFFFTYIRRPESRWMAMMVYYVYQGFLSSVAIVSSVRSFIQTSLLDYRLNHALFVDDVLMVIPLPFFFIYTILPFVSTTFHGNYLRSIAVSLMTIHVVIQTMFIIDGLRRCISKRSISNYEEAKRKGTESAIIFSIIVNLTLWIFNTMTRETAEVYHSHHSSMDSSLWLVIAHITLPQMLFFWFHSSVCLADIWLSLQAAYNIT